MAECGRRRPRSLESDSDRKILERFDQFVGQHLGLLSQVLRAHPVPGAYGFMGLSQESRNLSDEVILRGIQLAAVSKLQIPFGDADIVGGGANRGSLSFCRKLRRDLQRLRLWFSFRRSRFGFDGRPGPRLLTYRRYGLSRRLNVRRLGRSFRGLLSHHGRLREGFCIRRRRHGRRSGANDVSPAARKSGSSEA